MKRTILILLALLVAWPALATDYYCSSSTGSDANSGLAWNVPFKSLDKAAAAANVAGAVMYFRQGDVWDATRINVAGSGAAGNPIIFDVSAGWNPGGALPIISGRETIVAATVSSGTWVNMGSNIWRMGVANMGGSDMRRLWLTSATNSVTFEPKRAQTSTAPTTGTLWGMDTTNKRLYIYATAAPNTLYSKFVAAGYSQGVPFNCAGRDYITVRNIEVQGGYSATVQAYGDFCTFENMIVRYPGLKGFLIHGVGQDGGNGTTTFGNAFGHVIRGCTIDAMDQRRDGYEVVAPDDGIRLNAGSQNCEIVGNQINNFGHTGIYLTDGQGSYGWPEQTHDNVIHGNIICASAIDYGRGFGMDGGWQQGVPSSTAGGCYNNWFYNNLIYNVPARNQINGTTNFVFNNIIDGVLGVPWRTTSDDGQGVTFEGYSNGVCYGNVLESNLIMNTTSVACQFGVGSGSGEISNNKIINNIFYKNGLDAYDPNMANVSIWCATFTSIRLNNTFKGNAIYTGNPNPIYYRYTGATNVAGWQSAATETVSGNLQAGPLFTTDSYPTLRYGLGNYHQQANSPLINMGADSAIINPATAPFLSNYDYDGQTRGWHGFNDIGPYEYIASATLFFATPSGSDTANTGINSASPWATLGHIASATLSATTYPIEIALNRGSTFPEKLLIKWAGPGNVSDYGTGAYPVLTGADALANWTSAATNTYSASLDYSLNQVLEDGVKLTPVTWNTDLNTTWASMSAGTWTYDDPNNLVYVWATDGADPDTHTMEVSVRDSCYYGGTGNGYSNWTVQNIIGEKADSVACFYTGAASSALFVNLTARKSYANGLHLYGSNAVVRGCTAEDCYQGIRVDGDDQLITNNLIRLCNFRANSDNVHFEGAALNSTVRTSLIYNTIYGASNGSSADNVQIAGYTDGVTVAYNTIYNGRGVVLTNDTANTRIYYNVMYAGTDTPTLLGSVSSIGGKSEWYNNTIVLDATASGTLAAIRIIDTDPQGLIMKNNLVYSATRALWQSGGILSEITLDGNDYYTYGGGTLVTYNSNNYTDLSTYQTASGKDASSISAAPSFVNAAGRDYRLLSGSLCVDGGTDVSLTEDQDGNAVPYVSPYTLPYAPTPDIGAFECAVTVTTLFPTSMVRIGSLDDWILTILGRTR